MKKSSAGSLLKKIALFPLKVLLRVFEICVFIILATLITLAILSASRTSQPMVMREANNMTYSEFLAGRSDALGPFDSDLQKSLAVGVPVVKAFFASIPATASTLLPQYNLYATFHQIPHFTYIEDEDQRSWSDLPKLFWETFERASWAYMVFEKPGTDVPVNPNSPELAPLPSDENLLPTDTVDL